MAYSVSQLVGVIFQPSCPDSECLCSFSGTLFSWVSQIKTRSSKSRFTSLFPYPSLKHQNQRSLPLWVIWSKITINDPPSFFHLFSLQEVTEFLWELLCSENAFCGPSLLSVYVCIYVHTCLFIYF